MTKMKATKRALLSSALALFLCCAMLIGTTFAWFTDKVESKNNIIKAGNLDIELYYMNDETTDWTEVTGNSNVFKKNTLWEPGHVEVVKLKVVNAGTLDLKYQLSVNIADETESINVLGNPFKLSDYIKYSIIDGEKNFNTREEAVAAAEAAVATKLNEAYNSTTVELKAKNDATNESGEKIVTMVVYMPESVGNEANAKTGAAVPTIKLGINLFATQMASEEDSFGSDYDEDAPIVSAPIARPDAPVTLKGDQNVMIELTQELVDALPTSVEEISISISEPKVENNTITFDSIELVDQNGDIIDLDSLNLTEKITVTLPAQTTFAVGEIVMIYHDGEFVAAAVVDANGVISYDVEHLCEVTVATVEAPVENNNVVEISTAAQLFGLAQEVNSGKNYYEGKTIVLTADIDLKDSNWTPIGSAAKDHGFMGNFDGNDKTISNLSIKNIALDSDDYAYAGLFGVTEGIDKDNQNFIKDLTIKNVTIDTTGHIVAAAIAYPYYTAVENITVCGDIAIKGGNYTSGVLAYTRRCVDASNIAINGNEGSYITGANTVGGVISDIQMNGGLTANYSNFSAKNITVTGNKCVGGISGIIGGQTLNVATVENVELVCSDAHVGVVSGSYDSEPVINEVTASNVTGATAIAGAPYGNDSNGIVIIDGVECAGNVKEFKAQLETGDVNLACNIALNETITIANGKDVVINLNGNTIAGTLSGTGNQDLFLVKGNLTVKNGNVTLTATENQYWNAMSTIFDVTAGGVVTLNGVTAQNLGGTDMNFVAHLNNWGTASLYVENSTLEATYVAVRVFNSGYDMNNVTIKNSTVKSTGNAAFWVHNYTAADFGTQEKADAQAKLLNFDFENVTFKANKAAFRYGMTNAEYYTANDKNTRVVSTADELVAALEAGKDVVFANNIKIDPANMSNAYGKTGINVTKGQTIDGNGYTLDIKGAGGTWDSGINTTGGVIKNIKVTGSFRGIFINHTSDYSEKVVLENVVLEGVTYTISCDQGLNQTLEATNCTFNGWTSFAKTLGSAKFINCNFGEGNGYAYCRPYAPTEFIGCTFSEGYTVDDTRTTVTFENCNYNK